MDKRMIAVLAAVVVIVAAAAAAFVVLGDSNKNSSSDNGKDSTESSTYAGGAIEISTNDSTGIIKQTYSKAPSRIIAGNDTALELLLYLGLGDKIVGVYYDEDEISEVVKDEYNKLKSRLDSKYFLTGMMSQAVATELEPDFVIGYRSSFGDSPSALGTTAYWNNLGCNVMSLQTQAGNRTVEGLVQDYNDIGKIFDVKSKTDKFVSEYQKILTDYKAKEAKKIAIMEFSESKNTWRAYGDTSFIGQVLLSLGGVNAFPDGGNVPIASVVDGTDIDGIVFIAFGSANAPENLMNKILADENYKYVPAVKNKNVAAIGLNATYGGPTSLSTAKVIATLLGADTTVVSSYANGDVAVNTNDSTGVIKQTYTKAPSRIIAGNDTALEVLLYLGLGDKIVGVYYDEDEISDVVKDEYNKLKSRLSPEHFLTGMMSQAVATELEPDFVIGYRSSFGDSPSALGTTAYWNNLGCNVMSLQTQAGNRTVEGLVQDYNDIGNIFDIRPKTDAFVAEYMYYINSAKAEGLTGKIAIMEKSGDEWRGYGDTSFIGQELLACGGVNAFPAGGAIPTASVIDGTDIDGMVIISFGSVTPAERIQAIYDDANYSQIPAVQNENIVGIGLNGTYGGPSSLSTIAAIVSLLTKA